jgi:branched-chain amino acid transport system substrate-binding protein
MCSSTRHIRTAVYIFADAIKRAGKAERAAVAAAVPTTNLPGLTGQLAFDDKGDIRGGAISIFKVSRTGWSTCRRFAERPLPVERHPSGCRF